MKQDEFDRAVARAERAYAKLVRIRDGIEEVEHDDVLGIRRWRPGREVGAQRQHVRSSERRVLFNRPLTRSIRLANAAGATSFHIQHHAIGKVTHEMSEDGLRNRPGAARAHSRYVEREVAVAAIDPERAAEEATLGHGGEAGAADLDTFLASPPQPFTIDPENDHEHDWQQHLGFDPVVSGALVAELAGPESRPVGTWANGAGKDTGSDAGMWLLSRRDVVRHGRRADGHLPGAQDVSVEAGSEDDGLRQPSSHPRGADNPAGGLATLASVGEAPDHDRYIGRMEAVAIQPDGTRALITNIDPDDEERARFWSLVEKHEAVASADQMTIRVSDRPAFWAAVATQPDCPAELRQALGTTTPDQPIRFDIPSGKAMRAYLDEQPGWVKPTGASKASGTKPFAAFHDGRKGRIQYRVVGELPDELGAEERFAIVRDFATIFEQRRMPFVAVMHAPDHHNSEKNWHFHLIYYDRPCRRVSAADIAALDSRGYRTDGLEPGMWDFAVITPKRGRTNGKATPLKQNKVAEVTGDSWIKNLRHELAAITNRRLTRAGVERRLDPRRYTEMGIVADPQEHLGTRQAAAETRGETTKTGSDNEQRQWRAVMAEGDARHRQVIADADERVARYRRLRRGSPPSEAADEPAIALRDRLYQAARLDDIAFRLHHGIERARSRASHVRQANRQLVQAFDADPTAGRQSERDQSERLVAASSNYLDLLDGRLAEERALLADCHNGARAMRRQALVIEGQPRLAVAPPAMSVSIKPPSVEPIPPATPGVSQEATVAPTPAPPPPKEPSDAAKRAMVAAMAAARAAGR